MNNFIYFHIPPYNMGCTFKVTSSAIKNKEQIMRTYFFFSHDLQDFLNFPLSM